jgi:HK97 gp10 family phage protein
VSLSSFAALAARLATADADVKIATEAALEKICQLIEDRAKAAIGTYDFGWKQLAQSTQEQRVALGFSANEPLLRIGKLRDSIGHVVEGEDGYVGTNDPIAPFQEFGTSKIPPRPFLGGALAATEGEIPKIFGSLVGAAMRGGGPAYHELRELLHVAKHIYEEAKETGKEFLEDDREENR